MNATPSDSLSLFRDCPLPDDGHGAPLPLYRQEPTDFPEVLLRALLVLCVVISLLLCGLRIGGALNLRPSHPLFTPATAQAAGQVTPAEGV
jgi:hypothetical protein